MAETYTYKGDHADDAGNQYTIGVVDARGTSCQRVGYLYSDGGSLVNLKSAAELAQSTAGLTHPDNSLLKLKGVQTRRVAPNIVKVTLAYDGRPNGINPGKPWADLVRSDSGYVSFKSWHRSVDGPSDDEKFDAVGRPNGPLNFQDSTTFTSYNKQRNRPPTPLYYQLPIQVLRVPGLMSTDPSDDVVDLIGKLNSDSVTFAGVSRPKGTLQLQRFWCEPVIVDDAVKYRLEYTLAYRRSFWAVELPPEWDGTTWVDPNGSVSDGVASNTWYMYIAQLDTFTGAFPVED